MASLPQRCLSVTLHTRRYALAEGERINSNTANTIAPPPGPSDADNTIDLGEDKEDTDDADADISAMGRCNQDNDNEGDDNDDDDDDDQPFVGQIATPVTSSAAPSSHPDTSKGKEAQEGSTAQGEQPQSNQDNISGTPLKPTTTSSPTNFDHQPIYPNQASTSLTINPKEPQKVAFSFDEELSMRNLHPLHY